MSTIKTWAERAESLSDNTVVTSLHLAQFKQAEIDELRAENERLRAALHALVNALNSGHSLTIFDALTGAEAALGPNAEVNRNER